MRSNPFRLALGISLLAHAALLSAVLSQKWGMGGTLQQMRVRIERVLPAQPEPATAPVAPAPTPPAALPAPAVAAVERPAPVEFTPEVHVPAPALDDPRAAGLNTAPGPREASGSQFADRSLGDRATPEGLEAAAALEAAQEPAAGDAGGGLLPAGPQLAGGNPAPAPQIGNDAAGVAGGARGEVSTVARLDPGPGHLAAVRSRIEARKHYPRIAVRNGWQGRVLVEMRLEGDGSLGGVRLIRGSGYAVLDDATIAAVHRAAPFPPVASTLTVPVEYRLADR